MNKWKIFLLSVNLTMSLLPVIYASTIVINPDKTIGINGKKTFPIGIVGICHTTFDGIPYSNAPGPAVNTEFVFNAHYPSISWPISQTFVEGFRTAYENAGLFWMAEAQNHNTTLTDTAMNSPYFFGYAQNDEPDLHTTSLSTTTLKAWYDSVKARDPNHPVMLNVYSKFSTYLSYTDIISFDRYNIRDLASYPRAQDIHAYDVMSKTQSMGSFEPHSQSKPVWAVIQGNGKETINDTPPISVPSTAEVRALFYTALSMDINGIVVWGYNINDHGQVGLRANIQLHNYYRQMASELRGLNDVLILPTQAYSWYGHKDHINVLINPNPVLNFGGYYPSDRFNYLLKKNASTNTWYLFIVNKDDVITPNVQITIAGLAGSGNFTAKILGLETTGSQKAGRTIEVYNGVFIDTFDAYAAHIYEIAVIVPDTTIPSQISGDKLVIYPNPYIRGKSSSEIVQFNNLEQGAVIRIYNTYGELVKELLSDSKGKTEWDVTDESSGIYLYVVTSAEGVKKGKVSVIK